MCEKTGACTLDTVAFNTLNQGFRVVEQHNFKTHWSLIVSKQGTLLDIVAELQTGIKDRHEPAYGNTRAPLYRASSGQPTHDDDEDD